ncbi:MAG: hypothetical protein LBM07_08285 [Culturomica sp.]|jgi:hypothetical protein|nr:hypothetical protein [Culturomica sp.]
MESKNFTEKESFSIINEMIDRARNNVQKINGHSFLLWGYSIALIAVMNYLLLYILPVGCKSQSFNVWWLTCVVCIIDAYSSRRIDRSTIVKSYIDRIISNIWLAHLISIICFLIIIFSLVLFWAKIEFTILITPTIMILTGLAEFSTAKVCRFKPFMYGAIYFWVGALLSFLMIIIDGSTFVLQFIILAVCMLIGFVIPTYKLNKLAEENV